MARPFKFRTPTRCQNGHYRFLFYSINFGHCEPSIWERQSCDCPTGEIGEGFTKAGPEQQWTGLCDSDGRDLYEGDLVAHSKYQDAYIVEWSTEAAGFVVRSRTHSCALSALCQQYLTITGNVCKDRKCHRCGKETGLHPEQCTGWHPDFKCVCGYEEASLKAGSYENCPKCARPKVA